MSHQHENILNITSISQKAVEQLANSFEYLPQTNHADGKYRLRCYSVVKFHDGELLEINKHTFTQSKNFNKFQGDVARRFESILPSALKSDGMHEMCEIFAQHNELPDEQEIEIHQIRVATIYNETLVAPEGVHRDGYDYIAMIGIDRHNIVGGEIMVYDDNHSVPFYRKVLENREVIMLADNKVWHNARPISAIQKDKEGHLDLFVLTANGGNHNGFHS